MRFSAWSSLVISACSAALVLAAPAWGHLSVSPTRVGVGEEVDLTFAVANEAFDGGADRVTLTAPKGFDLDDGEAKPGWTQSRSGDTVIWSGGSIPKDQFMTFVVRGAAPKQAGAITFDVRVGDRTGKSAAYRVAVDVVSATTEDTGARSLGKAAIGVAIGAALLALAGLFVGIYVWLRPPA